MDCDAYFNQIYDQTYHDLLRYLVVKTSCAADVEDILQEVYRKFYTRICRRGHRDIDKPKAYLQAAANKELATFYKTRSIRMEQERPLEPDMDAEEISFAPQLEQRAAMREVWDIVCGCPTDSYRAFTLYYGFDVPIEKIATLLGSTPQAVKSRLFRTRSEVRRRLKGDIEL